jgi:hypothetical protein
VKKLKNQMYSNIIRDVENSFGQVKLNDYHRINKSLTNFTTNKFSVSMSNLLEPLGIDMDKYYTSLVCSQIEQTIERGLVKELEKISVADYIDIIGIIEYEGSRIVEFIIKDSGYSNCITNSKTAALMLQDSFGFTSTKRTTKSSGNIYKIGKLYDVDIYVDPFMKWDDDVIILFDNFETNSELVSTSIVSDSTISPRLSVDYNYTFNILDSKLYYIIEDTSSKHYGLIKTRNRDIKIDQILNDKDTFR